MRRLVALLLLIVFSVLPPTVHARAISPAEQQSVVAKLIDSLTANYVYPDRVGDISEHLEEVHKPTAASDPQTSRQFARKLSEELVAATNDQHFVVEYMPVASSGETLFELDDADAARRANFGLEHLEILPGNVGYLRLDHFPDPQTAYPALSAAMTFVENTDALLIDLRYNQGGYLETAQFIASHLFSGDEKHRLFRYFYNDNGETIQRSQWVLPAVPANRRPTVPVYMITSSTTFSAGEWLSFALKELGRATIVGQTTTGAAHPVNRFRLDDNFIVQMPIGKIFGPLSGGDFEGTGVKPDFDVASHRALDRAYVMALEGLAQGDRAQEMQWHLPFAKARFAPSEGKSADIVALLGDYEGRSFALEDGIPIYRWRGRFSLSLEPLGDGLFAVEGTEDYRFRLARENGTVIGVYREFREGDPQFYARLN